MASLISDLPLADVQEYSSQVRSLVDLINSAKDISDNGLNIFEAGGLASVLGSVAIPEATQWLGPIAGGLERVASQLPPKSGDLLGSLLENLSSGSDTLSGPLKEQLTSLAEGFQPISDLIQQLDKIEPFLDNVIPAVKNVVDIVDTAEADIASILGKIVEAFNLVPDVDNMPVAGDIKKLLESVHGFMTKSEAELGVFLTGTLDNLTEQLGEPFDTPLALALTRAEGLRSSVNAGNLVSALQGVTGRYEGFASMDLTSQAGIQAAIAGVNEAKDGATQFALFVQTRLGEVNTAVTDLSLPGLQLKLSEVMFSLERVIKAGQNSASPVGKLVNYLRRHIQGLDIEGFTTSIKENTDKAREALEVLDVSAVEEPLKNALEVMDQGLDGLEEALVGLVVEIGSALERVGSIVDGLDTAAAVQVIEDGAASATNAAQTAIDDVGGVVTALLNKFGELVSVIGEVDITGLRAELEGLLSTIKEQLKHGDVQDVIDTMKKAVAKIEEGIAGITFTPVFEQVNEEIDKQEEKLKKVDTSSLNPVLLGMLKAAIELIKSFEEDMKKTIVGELQDKFDTIADRPKVVLEGVKAGYNELRKKITDNFDPEKLLIEPLEEVLEPARTSIMKLSPAAMFEPVEKAFNDITGSLDSLDASVLLNPVKEQYDKAVSVVDSLNPSGLTGELESKLSVIADELDRLPVADVAARLGSLEEKVTSFVARLPEGIGGADGLTGAFDNQIDLRRILDMIDYSTFMDATGGLLEKLTENLDNINLDTVRPSFDALNSGIENFRSRFASNGIVPVLNTLMSDISGMGHTAALTGMQSAWSAFKARVDATLPPPGTEGEYSDLVTAINTDAPMVLLGSTMGGLGELVTVIGFVRTTVADIFRGFDFAAGELQHSLEKWRVPNPDHAAIKEMLTGSINRMLIEPVGEIIKDLAARKPEWEKLVEALELFVNELRAKLMSFVAVPALLKEMVDTAAGISDRIRNLDLSPVTIGLDTAYQSVRDKVASLDPRHIETVVQTAVTTLKDSLQGLYPKSRIDELDRKFREEILVPMAEWKPEELIGDLIEAVMKEIEEALDALDVEKVFESLVKCLDRLEQELNQGLENTVDNFSNMLAAAPV